MLILFQLWQRPLTNFLAVLETIYLRLTQPPHGSQAIGILTDLARTKADLMAENALLRQQLILLSRQAKPPPLTRRDRFLLLCLASRVRNWRAALLIIKPDTLLRWHRQGFRLYWRFKSRTQSNRSRISAEVIALIQRMARENQTWGAERIRGELLKLGIHVAKRTIQKHLRHVRPDSPRYPSWSTFLKNQAEGVWACDFLPVIDLCFRHLFIFFIIEVGTRRVVHFGVTRRPTDTWVAQQLREATPFQCSPKYLICDNDKKYGERFLSLAEASGIEVLRTPYRAPRANAVCERFLRSVRRECLDQMLIWNEAQLYQVTREYVGYFNRVRPHQGIEQRVPGGARLLSTQEGRRKILSVPVLNGLHHDYRRAA